MADEQLTALLSLEDQISAQLRSIIGTFKTLSDQTIKSEKDMSAFELGQKRLHSALQETQAHGKATGDVFEKLSEHSRTLGMGFETLGIQAGEGFARLDGAVEALKGSLMGVSPLMLGIAAAAAGLFFVFTQVGESMKTFGDSQAILTELGVLIKNQGGDWKALTSEIDEFSTHLAQTTQFGKDQFIGGIKAMLVAGMSLDAAMKSQQAAMDLATARTIPLQQAEEALAMAHNHRMRELQALGIVTRQEVTNGIAYDTILERIEKRMGGSAAAALATWNGQMQLLHNNVEIAREKFGEALAPALEAFNGQLVRLTQALLPLIADFGAWAQAALPAVEKAFASFQKKLAEFTPLINVILANAKQFWDTLVSIGNDIMSYIVPAFGSLLSTVAETKGGYSTFSDALTASQPIWEMVRAAIADVAQAFGDFVKWISDNQEIVRVFFDVTLAITAKNAITAVVIALGEMRAALLASSLWSGITLLVEAFSVALSGGLVTAIRAVIVGLYDLVGAEAAATLGLSLLVVGIIDLATHWENTTKQNTAFWNEMVAEVLGGVANVESAWAGLERAAANLRSWFDNLIGVTDADTQAMYRNADAADKDAAAQRALAQAKRDAAATPAGGDTSETPDANSQRGLHHGGVTGESNNLPKTTLPPSGGTGDFISGTGKPKKEKKPKADSFTNYALADDKLAPENKEVKDDTHQYAVFSAALKAATADQKGLSEAVKLATTVSGQHAAQQALENAKMADAKEQIRLTQEELNKLAPIKKKENNETAASADAYEKARAKYNEAADSLNHVNHATQEQKQHVENLKRAMDDAEKAHTKHQAALEATRKRVVDLNASLVTLKDTLTDGSAIQAGVDREVDKFKTSSAEKYKEDRDTFNLTQDQKYAYYADRLAKMGLITKDNLEEWKRLYGEELNAFKAVENERVAYHKKIVDEMTRYVGTFVDDVVAKHMSMKDILKSIYDELLKAFVLMITKMIVQSALFKQIAGNLSPGMGGGGGGGFLSFLGGGGSAAAGGGGGSLLSTVPGFSSLNAMPVELGGQSIKALTGSSSGISPFAPGGMLVNSGGGLTLMGGLGVAAGAAGIGGFVGSKVGGPGAPNSGMNGAIGGVLGAGAVAAGLGIGLGPGAAALLAAGPAGWAMLLGGAVLGGALGGMIGPHWGDPSNYPDRGPGAADYQNWLGSFNSGPGGVGDKTEKLIAGMNASSLTGQALADFNQLKQLENGSGQLGITNEHNGVFSFIGGTTDTVTDFRTLVDRFNQETAGAAGAIANSPIFSVTRFAPDFNTARVGAWTANSTNSPWTGSNVVAPGQGPTIDPPLPPVVINVNTLVGTDGMNELANIIQRKTARNAQVNYANQSANNY